MNTLSAGLRALPRAVAVLAVLWGISVGPLPAAEKTFALNGATLALEEATADVGVVFTALRFNRAARVWNVEASLTNRSAQTWQGPFVVLVESFSGTSGVLQPDGQAANSQAFFDLSGKVTSSELPARETSRPRTLTLGFQAGAAPQLNVRIFARRPPLVAGLSLVRTLDDAGLPLPAVTVEGAEAGAQTDATFGLATLTLTNATRALRFSAPAFLPVWRIATVSSNGVSIIPHPRLTRRGTNPVTLTPIAGGKLRRGTPPVEVSFTPGAFSQDTAARLTPLTGQTLPLFLPPGWSPLAAFWLELAAEPALPGTATVTPWGPISAGETAALVRLNTNTPAWEVVQLLRGNGTNAVTVAVPGSGAFALVVADAVPIAPPAPVVGGSLSPSTTPLPDPANLRAGGTVTPSSSPASQLPELVTGTAEVVVTNLAGNLPSGTLLRGEVSERYTLRDGTRRFPALFDNFVVGYQRPGDMRPDTVRAEFPIRPLLLFGAEELQEAIVRMDLFAPGAFSGGILGTNGGQVASDGLRVLAGTGDLRTSQAVPLQRLAVTNFTELVGSNATVVAAFEIGVNGVTAGRRLILQLEGLTTNANFVLARVLAREGLYGLEPRERLHSDASGSLQSDEPASGAQLPGLNGAGQYLLLRINPTQGLVSGIAQNRAGQPAGGLPVRITGQPWLTFSAMDGTFQLLAPAGAATLTVTDLVSGDRGAQNVTVPIPLTPVNTTLAAAPSRLQVVRITPTNNAANVPRVTAVVVEFDQAINPATLAAGGLALLNAINAPVAASLTLNLRGTVATLLPVDPLAASTQFTLRLSTNVAGLTGNKLAGTNQFTFTTESDALNRVAGQFIIFEPTNGLAPVSGSAGTADPESPVILVNETSGQTATILSKPDGSFTNFIGASVDDFISAVLVNQNGTRITVPASRQIFRDGRVGLFQGGGVLEAQSAGGPVQVIIEPGAIRGRSVFKVESLPLAQILAAANGVLPRGAKLLQGFRFQVAGDLPKAGLDVSFTVDPASFQMPPGENPEDAALGVLVPTEVDGVTAYQLVDKVRYKDGKAFSNTLPFPGIASFLLGGVLEASLSFNVTLAFFGSKPVVVSGRAVEPKVPLGELSMFPRFVVDALLEGGFFGNLPGNGENVIDDLLKNDKFFKPVSGAFVFAREITTTNSLPGRLQAGSVYATSDRTGIYALALPISVGEAAVPFSNAVGYDLVAIHPRYKHRLGEALSFSEIGVDLGEKPFFRRNLIFSGPLATGGTTPSLRVQAALQPTAPATNQPALLRAVAFGNQGAATFTVAVEGLASTVIGQTVLASDVQVENQQTTNSGNGSTTFTATFTCSKAAQALIRITATSTGAGGQLSDNVVVIVRFGEAEPPLPDNLRPADLTDKTGPRVLRANLADDGTLPTGGRIVLQLSEPVSRLAVTKADAILILPAPLTPPAVFLSADQKTIEVFPGLFADPVAEAKLTLTSVIRDLAGNDFDQSNEPGNQDYGLKFRVSKPRQLALGGIENGGGVVSHRGFIYALDRGATPGVRIFRTDNVLAGNSAPVGSLTLIGQPRDLLLIRDWPHQRSLHDPQVRTADLLVVVGGDAGSKVVDADNNVFFAGQFLRVFDLSDPAAPERIHGAQLTLRNTVVSRIAWNPPHLAYIESGSDLQQVVLLNLQAMLVGFNATPAERDSFSVAGFAGVDLDQNGSFVQANERLPTPERTPLELFGKESSFVLNEPGLIQDVALARGFVGVVTTGGPDPVAPLAAPSLPAYRTLRANDASLPEDVGVLHFGAGARPKRLTVLLDELVSVNGQLVRRSLGLVSMAPDHDGKNRVVLVDLATPAVPTLLTNNAIELPEAVGFPQSIIRREDGLLALATTTHLLLLDPQRLLDTQTGGAGTAGQAARQHPAVVAIIPQAGSGNRTQDSDATGVNLVNLGGRHELVQSAPRLSFVIFPTNAAVANPTTLIGNDAALDTLMGGVRPLTGIPLARLTTKGGAVSSITPPSPLTHSHVLIECPGGAGPTLAVALESLNAGGYTLKDKGKDFAPARAVASATLQALKQDAGSIGGKDDVGGEFRAPVVSLNSHRLSADPASRYYNLYLSEPFALIREKITRAQLQALALARPILGSGHALRASLDASNAGNGIIGVFADRVDPVAKVIQPGAFVIADTLATAYIPGNNPPPPGAEISFPGTFELVNALNGEVRRTEVDLVLPSRRLPIIFQRTLAGQDLTDGPFGPGWDFTYNQHLVEFKAALFPPGSKAPVVMRDAPERHTITESRDVQFVDGEGHVILFKNQGTNAPAGVVGDPLADELGWFTAGGSFYTPDLNTKNVFDLLYRFPSKEYCRLTPAGTQFWYAEDGRLLRIKDRHTANRHELEYNSRGELLKISDFSVDPPRTLELGRYRLAGDAQSGLDATTNSAFVAGQICALRDFAGRVVNYEYTPTGTLLTVRHPETDSTAVSGAGPVGFKGRPVTRYLLNAPAQGGFQGVTKGNGANDAGGGGNSGTPLFAATLDTTGGKPVATGGSGAGGAMTTTVKPDNSAEAGAEAGGNAGKRADQSDTKFSFDAHGQPTGLSQTGPKADEAATGIVYAPEPELRGLVKSITGPEGDKLTFDYFNGSLIRSKPNVHTITRTPGPRGGPVITSSFSSYDLRYNLPTGASQNANTKTVTYTLTPDHTEIASIDYGNGALLAWTYNEFGQRLTESTPDGVTRSWDPDSTTGFLRSQSIGPLTTTFAYDGSVAAQLGQPTTLTVPRGQPVSMTYDTRLLPLSQTRGAQQVKHAYDENGNEVFVSTVVDAGSTREEIRTFNQISFLTTRTVKGVESGAGASADLVTTYVPDEVFRVKEVHLPAPTSETQVMDYDNLGRLLTITTGEQVTDFSYDLNGNLRKTKLANAGLLGGLVGSIIEENIYDGHDRPITIKRPGSGGDDVTTLTYFDGGELKTRKTTGATGGEVEDVETPDVDGYGRPTGMNRRGTLASGVIGYSYTRGGGGLTTVQTGPKDTLTRETDAAGRMAQLNDSLAARTFTVNGSFKTEKVSSVESGTTYQSAMSYDDLDRLRTMSDDVGTVFTYTPRLDGLPTQSIDALNRPTAFTHSKLGELLRVDRPQSLRMSREYDTNRRLVGVRDREPKGHGYFFEDGRLRMTKQTLRNGAEIKFNVPNGFNLPAAVLLPGGGNIALGYDGQGRPVSATVLFNGTTHKVENTKFDAAGRVRSVSYQTHDTANSAAFTYDKLGPLTGATYTEGGTTYTFAHGIREDGARTRVTYPSGTLVTEERDASGRLTKVSIAGEGAPIWEATAFAGTAEPKTITRGPLTETRSYDLRKRLVACKVIRPGGGVLSDWRYVWDAADNLSARQAFHEQGRADLFSYDDANRLTRVHFGARPAIPGENAVSVPGLTAEQGLKPGYAARTFTYDAGGLDLLTTSVVTDAPEPKPVPLAPFAQAIAGHDGFLNAHTVDGFDRGVPDALGNTAKIRHEMLDPAGQFTVQTATLTHNGRNELVKAGRGGDTFLFHYRPDHLLHRKTRQTAGGTVLTDRALVWHGPLLLEEYDILASPKRLLARYYYADGDTPVAADLADAGGTLRRFHFLHDNVMSVTAVVDDLTAQVVERMHYDPWGHSLVELRDIAAPQVARVFEETGGALLIQFTEPVLPSASAAGSGLVTGAGGLDSLFSATQGGGAVSGRTVYVETAGGLPFGTLVRFTPSSSAPGTLTLVVVAGKVFDSWGNGNAAQSLAIPLAGGLGVRFTGTVTDTRPPTQAASAAGNPFRFQGQYAELDLGLIYMRARFYDPLTATFLERDPMEYEDSVNLYAALGQAPTSTRDPMGTSIKERVGAEILETVLRQGAKETGQEVTQRLSREALAVGRNVEMAAQGRVRRVFRPDKKSLPGSAGRYFEETTDLGPEGLGYKHNLHVLFSQWGFVPKKGEPGSFGYKLHVTITDEFAEEAAQSLLPVLRREGVVHKVTKSLEHLGALNKTSNPGKFITIYTRDVEQAKRIVGMLEKNLQPLAKRGARPGATPRSRGGEGYELPLGKTGFITGLWRNSYYE